MPYRVGQPNLIEEIGNKGRAIQNRPATCCEQTTIIISRHERKGVEKSSSIGKIIVLFK